MMRVRLEGALKGCLHYLVRAKVLGIFDRKQMSQPQPSAVHPALDRASRDTTDLGRFLIGQALGHDQKQRLSLINGDLGQCSQHILNVTLPILLGRCPRRFA